MGAVSEAVMVSVMTDGGQRRGVCLGDGEGKLR